jgi:uncharacterized membrane protein YkvA (DUF1232 family)
MDLAFVFFLIGFFDDVLIMLVYLIAVLSEGNFVNHFSTKQKLA